MSWIDTVAFGEDGLVPVITQERGGQVLMQAYANAEALELTRTTRQAWYWSRQRKRLWRKGETSGNTQEVLGITLDCDRDSVLYLVRQNGAACHTGAHSCFYSVVEGSVAFEGTAPSQSDTLARLTGVIRQRKRDMPEGSYVARLFDEGSATIARKVGEEAAEFMVALLAEGRERAVSEMADLLFHSMIALEMAGAGIDDALAELHKRER